MEAAERRDALIKAEAARLRGGTNGPVIAAGSTGSMPSTAELIAAIATLPHGAVVLPGLDTDLDEESWRLIAGDDGGAHPPTAAAVEHPQFAMHALLRRIGIGRDQVTVLAARPSCPRERYVSEALRPAASSERWQDIARSGFPVQAALQSLCVIEAANAEEEALAIAVALREALEEQKTAALITPDRALARRVLAALGRWNVPADDSGGDALFATPAGRFACLAAETALAGVAPVALLALLKHRGARRRVGSVPRGAWQAALRRAIAAASVRPARAPSGRRSRSCRRPGSSAERSLGAARSFAVRRASSARARRASRNRRRGVEQHWERRARGVCRLRRRAAAAGLR